MKKNVALMLLVLTFVVLGQAGIGIPFLDVSKTHPTLTSPYEDQDFYIISTISTTSPYPIYSFTLKYRITESGSTNVVYEGEETWQDPPIGQYTDFLHTTTVEKNGYYDFFVWVSEYTDDTGTYELPEYGSYSRNNSKEGIIIYATTPLISISNTSVNFEWNEDSKSILLENYNGSSRWSEYSFTIPNEFDNITTTNNTNSIIKENYPSTVEISISPTFDLQEKSIILDVEGYLYYDSNGDDINDLDNNISRTAINIKKNPAPTPEFIVSNTDINIDWDTSVYEIKIECLNTTISSAFWVADLPDDYWLEIIEFGGYIGGGTSTGKITFRAKENNLTGEPITGTITISAKEGLFPNESHQQVITITQGVEPPPDLYIYSTAEYDFSSLGGIGSIEVKKEDLTDTRDAFYSVNPSSVPSWVSFTGATTNIPVPPGETDFTVSENILDFAGRIGTISLSSESPFVADPNATNPDNPNKSSYNTITVNQSACPPSVTEDLKPKLAALDNKMKLIHYDPDDSAQHTIKTNVITDLDAFITESFIATTVCDYDIDGIDEQVVLHFDIEGYMLLFYELGESAYSKKIILGDYSTDFDDIESADVNNDGIDEIIVAAKNKFIIVDITTEIQSHSYDLISENFTGNVTITSGNYDLDNTTDIAITDGLKVVTLSVNKSNIQKIIPDIDAWMGTAYYFRDLTTYNENGTDRLILVYQGLDFAQRYTTYIYEYAYNGTEFSRPYNSYGIEIPNFGTKDIRKIVSGDFIEDNGKEELAILHSKYNQSYPSQIITNTRCISIFEVDRVVDARPPAPLDELIIKFQIDASEYIENYVDLTAGQFYDPLRIVLKAGTELVINPGDESVIFPNARVIAETGSKITVKDGALLELTNVTITGADSWKGITAEVGSSVVIANSTITNAETALSAIGANVSVNWSSFVDCFNGVSLTNCTEYTLNNNYFKGMYSGYDSGISLTECGGSITGNTVTNFGRGVILTLSSVNLIKNKINANRLSGVYVTGYNVPQMINSSDKIELNNEIKNNGDVQVLLIYHANVYLTGGYNNIYSDPINEVPSVTCIYTAGWQLEPQDQLDNKAILPNIVRINADRNYWGYSGVISDNFDSFFGVGINTLHQGYSLVYEPYAVEPYTAEPGINPRLSSNQPPTAESKLLSTALMLEDKGNIKPAIKKYEQILSKYPDSPEAYAANARLPELYLKAEIDVNELLMAYDEALESDVTTDKKFFKQMKITANTKSAKYDEAIRIAEEMKAEAENEAEVTLADLSIAIAKTMKNNGKSNDRSGTNTINDLLAKLSGKNGEEQSGEPSDITESVLPSQHELHQNYPNPFNPFTQIKFALAKTSDVKLTVYNITGQKVAELASGLKTAGYHSVNFDGSRFNSGVYYYMLEVDGKSMTKKMVLTK